MKASPAPSTLKTSIGKPRPTMPSSMRVRDRVRERRRSPSARASARSSPRTARGCGEARRACPPRRRRCGSPPRCRRSGRSRAAPSADAPRPCRSGCSAPRPRHGRRGPRGSAGSRCRRRPCRPAARAIRIAFRCAAAVFGAREMRAGDDDRAGRGDEVLVDVGFGRAPCRRSSRGRRAAGRCGRPRPTRMASAVSRSRVDLDAVERDALALQAARG